MARTAQEILGHHAEVLAAGDLEGIVEDYTDDAVMITPRGTFTGKAGARAAWLGLLDDLPNATVAVNSVVIEGDVVLMAWAASSDKGRVDDGIDTLILGSDGIRVQTIHHTPAR